MISGVILLWRREDNLDSDGILKVEITEDEMTAIAFVSPPIGNGRPVSLDDLKHAIAREKIVFGLKDDATLVKGLNHGLEDSVDFVVAEGEKRGEPVDATIEYLWLKDAPELPHAENERVNLRELNVFKAVLEQEVIAVKTPAVSSGEGTTVTGRKVPEKHGKDISVKIGPNVELSEDGTKYIASVAGAPKLLNNTISVDPVLVVKGNVDYRSGNINFIGSVEIKGDVLDGFVVKAGGNIMIGGNVHAANVLAGGDIIVKGGIVTQMEGYVMAEGSVHAKYIENSIVEADLDITSNRAIINSFVRANGSVHCTSREGKIVGGDVMAFEEIRAKVLGTEFETTTILRAGYDFKAYLKLNDEQEKLKALEEELSAAEKNLSMLRKDLEKTQPFSDLSDKVKDLKERKTASIALVDDLKKKMKTNKSATIRGEEAMHSGSVAHIGQAKLKISHTLRYTTLMADKEDNIAFAAFDAQAPKPKKQEADKDKGKDAASQQKPEKKSAGPAAKQPVEPRASAGKPAQPPVDLPTVLVVDDTDFYRDRLKKILTNSNFHVVGEAANGKDAVRQYVKLKPDVVTMDIAMPEMDGITALLLIRRVNPFARIIMISSTGDKELMTKAMRAGGQDFIMKPFSAAKVVEVMFRALSRQNQ